MDTVMLVALALLVVSGQWLLGLVLAARVSDRLLIGSAAFAALTPLLGLVTIGSVTVVAGHLSILGAWLPWSGAAVGVLLTVLERRRVADRIRLLIAALREQWKLAPISVSAVSIGLVLAAVASLAPPFRVDEKEYHWAAPVEWAQVGRWVESSFRHVDSFPFMEVVYTYAATVQSYAGAHLMHLSTLVALGGAAAWAAGAVGVRASGAVAAATMAMPVVWDQAYVAYNDTAVAAFSMTAVAVALRARWDRPSVLLMCLMLAAAISIKPTAVGAVGVVGLIVLIDAFRQGGAATRTKVSQVARRWAVLAVVGLGTLALWTARRYLLTGTWVDPDVAGPPTADELSRLPDLTDRLVAPVMPFVLGLVGSSEPWGGRIALVLQIFLLPAIVYAAARRRDIGHRFARVMVPAWTHWVVVGLVGLRTRFHVITWAMMVVAVRIAMEDASRRYVRIAPWLSAAWAGAVVLGVVDSTFEMIRVIQTIQF